MNKFRKKKNMGSSALSSRLRPQYRRRAARLSYEIVSMLSGYPLQAARTAGIGSLQARDTAAKQSSIRRYLPAEGRDTVQGAMREGLWIPPHVSTKGFCTGDARRKKGRFLRTSGVFRFGGPLCFYRGTGERNLRPALRNVRKNDEPAGMAQE